MKKTKCEKGLHSTAQHRQRVENGQRHVLEMSEEQLLKEEQQADEILDGVRETIFPGHVLCVC